mmetsp:Transcript_33736/g.43095  ORF Transcript_33736/g.43095 Transcript_33736/m.43095 type:complete len:415 (+) Transcript_33736:61-1305(+)
MEGKPELHDHPMVSDDSDDDDFGDWADAMVDASSSTSLFDQLHGNGKGMEETKGFPNQGLTSEEEAWYQNMMAEGSDNSIVKDAEDSIWASLLDGLVQPSSSGDQELYRPLKTNIENLAVKTWLTEYLPRTGPLIKKLELKIAGSDVAKNAEWFVDRLPDPQAVIVLDPKQGRGPGFLELATFTMSPALTASLVSAALPTSCTSLQIAHLDSFYERELFSILERKGFDFDWKEPCGFWYLPPEAPLPENLLPQNQNIELRRLQQDDVDLVNFHWTYKSDHSKAMIEDLIALYPTSGLWRDGVLIAWMCTYHDGAIGMLYTMENYRRQGFAKHVLCHLIAQHRSGDILVPREEQHNQNSSLSEGCEIERNRPIFCFIVDSNEASSQLFEQIGFSRICDASWVKYQQKHPLKRKHS